MGMGMIGPGFYIFSGIIVLALFFTILAVVAIWRGTGYKSEKISDSQIKTLQDLKEQQQKIAEDIAELRDRTMNIETILREVE